VERATATSQRLTNELIDPGLKPLRHRRKKGLVPRHELHRREIQAQPDFRPRNADRRPRHERSDGDSSEPDARPSRIQTQIYRRDRHRSQGDLHDIGKNLVCMCGKAPTSASSTRTNVSPEKFVAAAKSTTPKVICLLRVASPPHAGVEDHDCRL